MRVHTDVDVLLDCAERVNLLIKNLLKEAKELEGMEVTVPSGLYNLRRLEGRPAFITTVAFFAHSHRPGLHVLLRVQRLLDGLALLEVAEEEKS